MLPPRPVCIVGMHRAGTSLVAQVLGLSGLHLGVGDDLMPPSPANPDGYWEHLGFVALNDDLLGELEGAWDRPPAPPASWHDARFDPFRARAVDLVGTVAGSGPWGWKDPRTSLLLPFWSDILPDLQPVVVVRHPLDVAASLRRRDGMDLPDALALWETYYRRVLADTRPGHRVVTHYDAYFEHPASELGRVLTAIGLPVTVDALARCEGVISADLRHGQSSSQATADAGVAPAVVDLYRQLRAEAAANRRGPVAAAPLPPPAAEVAALRVALAQQDAKLRWQQQENAALASYWEARWAEVMGASSWRLAQRLQLARHRMAPAGSRRERLWRAVMQRTDFLSNGALPATDAATANANRGAAPQPASPEGSDT